MRDLGNFIVSARCHLNEVFADLHERDRWRRQPYPGRQTRTQQFVHQYPAMLKIILELHHIIELVIPSIRAAPQETERHPAFAEFAPWPEAFTVYSNDAYRTLRRSLRCRSVHFPSSNEAVPDWNLAQDCLAASTAASIPERKKALGVSPRPSFAITSSLTAARETAPREVALDISAETSASFFSLQASWRPSSVWPWLSWPWPFSPELFWRPLVRA